MRGHPTLNGVRQRERLRDPPEKSHLVPPAVNLAIHQAPLPCRVRPRGQSSRRVPMGGLERARARPRACLPVCQPAQALRRADEAPEGARNEEIGRNLPSRNPRNTTSDGPSWVRGLPVDSSVAPTNERKPRKRWCFLRCLFTRKASMTAAYAEASVLRCSACTIFESSFYLFFPN